jgi:putative DNA primase/helicase
MGMLVPPSIHPETKKAYRWLEGHSPWEIPFPEFPREIYDRIKALLPRPEPPRMMAAQMENASLGPLDVARYLRHYGIPHKVKATGDRTIYALERCLWADQHTTPDVQGDSSIIQGADGKLGYHCFHSHCFLRTWQDARQVISGNTAIAEFCRGYKPRRQAKDRGEDLLRDGILSVDDFLALSIPPMDFILPPWLTEQSLVLISGWRGTGKTWFGLSLLDAITKGQDFGPWKTEKPVPCLYLDAEMPAPEIQYRFGCLGRSNQREAPFYLYSDAYMNSLGMPRANLLNHKWRAAMKDLLLSKEIKLWAIDNLASLTPNVDENLKIAWDPVNQFLIELRFLGIATIMFHHVSKIGDQRGTSAREDNIDLSIRLDRPPDYTTEDGARFILRFSKHRLRSKDLSAFGDVEFQLQELMGQLTWTFTGTKVKNKVSVLRCFRDGVKQKEIPEVTGLSKGQVSKIKTWHIAEKHLTANGEVTGKGLEFIGEK